MSHGAILNVTFQHESREVIRLTNKMFIAYSTSRCVTVLTTLLCHSVLLLWEVPVYLWEELKWDSGQWYELRLNYALFGRGVRDGHQSESQLLRDGFNS